jgi:hypothetical protein
MITEYKIRVGIKKELYNFFKNNVESGTFHEIDKDILSFDKQFDSFPDYGFGMILYMIKSVDDQNKKTVTCTCVREYVCILRE